jgi:hypothetical protein
MTTARNAGVVTEKFREDLAELIAPLGEDMALPAGQRAAFEALASYIRGLPLDDHRLVRLMRASGDGSVGELGWDLPGGHLPNLLLRYGADAPGSPPVADPSAGLDLLANAAESDAAERIAGSES